MHIQCDYKSVVSYCGWLTDNLKIFSKYAETKMVGMQIYCSGSMWHLDWTDHQGSQACKNKSYWDAQIKIKGVNHSEKH